MYNILVVDDEAKIRLLIKKYADFEGHSVVEAENGLVAIERCRDQRFDLIIMDIMMPELDGFSAVKEIRKFNKDIPVIMLSARGEEYDKIHGFESGIDDYVVKPFSPKELMMRIEAIMKRCRKSPDEPAHEIYSCDGLIADFTARKITIDGQVAEFSPKEYDLMFYLIQNRNIALSRDVLIRNVWGYDFFGDDRTLDTHIKRLRKALGPYAARIVTLRNVGYRFEG